MRKVKWRKLLVCLSVIFGCGYVAYGMIGAARNPPEKHRGPYIEYRKEIVCGDTVWGVCSTVATDKENISQLVWETMRLNEIDDPENLQPGQELIVRVKPYE